jgi:hypothetical protein
MSKLSRRGFVVGVGSLAVSRVRAQESAAEPISDVAPDLDDAALLQVFVDNTEPPDGHVVKGLNDWPLWWNKKPLERAVWPQDPETIDYAHLPQRSDGRSFLLSDAALRRIVEANDYTRMVPEQPLVLFGVRGARQVRAGAASAEFHSEIEIVEGSPDHFEYRCLLGVWNRTARKLWVTSASTVPHVAYLFAQREAGTFGNEANMVPTGLYRYAVGTHRNATSSFQPGAFRPDLNAFAVLRCVQDGPLTLGRRQFWDVRPSNHGDNIHAGTYTARDDRPKFWSAGCQVISGSYSGGNLLPQGDWARFRVAAGLARTPVISRRKDLGGGRFEIQTSEDGRKFSYLLITGRDVRLAGENALPRTLRFGSAGATVKSLQAALGIAANKQDGFFGMDVQARLLKRGHFTTPIVDSKLVRELRIALPAT